MKHIFILLFLLSQLYSQEKIFFGVTAITDIKILQKQLSPLLEHIEATTGKRVEILSGFDYADTIEKFSDGSFHLGYIGPIPYIKVTQKDPHALEILSGVKDLGAIPFQAAIVVRKDSSIQTITDLKNHSFAFGSQLSTLSYFVPFDMLLQKKILTTLSGYDFLGRHDLVAQYVIMGKYDAGALMHSIAYKYKEYLKIIALSHKVPNFSIVMSTYIDKDLQRDLRQAIQSFPNKSDFRLEQRTKYYYDSLRQLMQRVENSR